MTGFGQVTPWGLGIHTCQFDYSSGRRGRIDCAVDAGMFPQCTLSDKNRGEPGDRAPPVCG